MKFTDLLAQVGRFVSVANGTPPDGYARVWQELSPWLGVLGQNAASKWLRRLAVGIPCELEQPRAPLHRRRCTGLAVAACQACGRAVCLQHARIDHTADAVCLQCVAWLIEQRSGAGAATAPKTAANQEQALRAARKVLHVKKSATVTEIKAAYRKQVAEWHPDKFATKSIFEQTQAKQRFQEVAEAFEVLKADQPEASW